MRPIPIRFWEKVDKTNLDGCWLWTAYKDDGYGIFATSRDGIHKNFKAHVMSYILTHGEFDGNMCVCHRCDNPSCVNPNHLFLGSHANNMKDKAVKGRAIRHSRKIDFTTAETIRIDYNKGMTQKQLAIKYMMTRQNIGKIILNKTFRGKHEFKI